MTDKSDRLDFSSDRATQTDAATNSTTGTDRELTDKGEYDTDAHRRERIEQLRDRAVNLGFEARAAVIEGDVKRRRWPDQENVKYVDSSDRRARTLFRESVVAYVREAFQVISHPGIELDHDYEHGAKIGEITSRAPEGYIQDIQNFKQFAGGGFVSELLEEAEEPKTHEVVGLREFVETDSPVVFEYHERVYASGHPDEETAKYRHVAELDWQDLHNTIEITTNALTEAGIGLEFDGSDEWEL